MLHRFKDLCIFFQLNLEYIVLCYSLFSVEKMLSSNRLSNEWADYWIKVEKMLAGTWQDTLEIFGLDKRIKSSQTIDDDICLVLYLLFIIGQSKACHFNQNIEFIIRHKIASRHDNYAILYCTCRRKHYSMLMAKRKSDLHQACWSGFLLFRVLIFRLSVWQVQ